MALEKGLLFLLERVGVLMEPRPPSARLLTLVTLPLMFHPASDQREIKTDLTYRSKLLFFLPERRLGWGEELMMLARYCSASKLVGTSLA